MRAESLVPKEAAALVACSVQTLKLAAERGELHVYRQNGCRVFNVGELLAWAKARGLVRT